jgi:hypothetical protein
MAALSQPEEARASPQETREDRRIGVPVGGVEKLLTLGAYPDVLLKRAREKRDDARLAPYVFVRPGELRAAEWSELVLDGDEPLWRIPAERMKNARGAYRAARSTVR